MSTRIEAGGFTEQDGMVFNPDLVPHLGYISNDDYVTYNFNFIPGRTNYRINFIYALRGTDINDGGTWEARLGGVDGEIIGTYQPLPTSSNDWVTYVEDTFSLQRTTGEPLVGDKITFVARTGDVAAPDPELVYAAENGDNAFGDFPLQECQGDCDDDSQCASSGLICFKRDGLEPVSGCSGLGISAKDYCVRSLLNFGWFEIGYVEDLNIPTNSPTTLPTNQPTNAPTNVCSRGID